MAVLSDLLDHIHRGEVPSFSVSVVRGPEVLWQEGLGWADREADIPSSTETLYGVASVSKSITATGALIFSAEGRLKLDQPVDSILGTGWMPVSGDPSGAVLVSHLLDHTSGIPSSLELRISRPPGKPPQA